LTQERFSRFVVLIDIFDFYESERLLAEDVGYTVFHKKTMP